MLANAGRLIPVAIFVLFSLPLKAQLFYFRDSLNVVKLEQHLMHAKGRKNIDIRNQIAAQALNYNPLKAFETAQRALQESERLNYRSGIVFAASNIGHYYFLNSDFRNAILFQIKALNLIDNSVNKETAMLVHERIGYIYYFSRANTGQIVDHFSILRNYYDSTGQHDKAASVMLVQGGGSYRVGKLAVARSYFLHFLDYAEKNEVPVIEQLIVNYSLGDIYIDRREYDSAWKYYKRCLGCKDSASIEEKALLSNIFLKAGNYYNRKGKTDSSLHFYKKALHLSKAIYYTRGMMNSNVRLGYLYKSTGDIRKSLDCFRLACRYGKQIDSSGSFFHHPQFRSLIDVTEETWLSSPKDFKKYFGKLGMAESLYNQIVLELNGSGDFSMNAMVDRLLSVKDSLFNYRARKEITDLALKYETQSKEEQIVLLQNVNELAISKNRQRLLLNYGLAGFIITGLFIVIFYMRQNRLVSEQEKTGLQQRLFRSQMNPHFIYNSLSCIQSFIVSHDPEMANKYLAHFARLMRNILNSSAKEFILLDEEISTIENYLELQKVRFADKFGFSIEVDERLDTLSLRLPPMLAQPFIENSIEHGIRNKQSPGFIEIRFLQKMNSFLYEIADDGIGREKARTINKTTDNGHRSMATRVTRERLKVINRSGKNKIKLSIYDLKDESGEAKGTKVVLEIPMNL